MNKPPVRVLLVDDDEDDFIITRELIFDISRTRYQLDWVADYDEALAAIQQQKHDICLLDYRLGAKTGLDLLHETKDLPLRPPMRQSKSCSWMMTKTIMSSRGIYCR